MLITPSPRIAKPSGQQLELDRSHPLARNLEFAVVFDNGGVARDLVHGFSSTPTNAPVSSSVAVAGKGSGCDFPAAGSAYQAFGGTVSDTPYLGAITILWTGVVRTGSNFREFLQKTSAGGAANCPFDFRTDNAATPALNFVRSNASGFNTWSPASGGTVTLGSVKCYAVTNNGGGTTPDTIFYINGAASSAILSGSSTPPWTGTSQPIWIGRRQDGGVQMDGVCLHAFVWSRVLTANELLWLTYEPYAFVRQSGRLFVAKTPSAASAFKFRRTLSQLGTRTSSRQVA